MKTTNVRRGGLAHRRLRVALVVGSLAASLLGTQIVASKDMANAIPEPAQAVVPVYVTTTVLGPEGKSLDLPPIPTAVAPLRPVARTRSSR